MKLAEINRKTNKVVIVSGFPDDFDYHSAPIRMIDTTGLDPLPEHGWHCDDEDVMTPPTQEELDGKEGEKTKEREKKEALSSLKKEYVSDGTVGPLEARIVLLEKALL